MALSFDSCFNICRKIPEVTIEQGTLRGFYATDIHGNSFIKFKGIPYAKPPLGPFRFKAPQPPDRLLQPLDCTLERNDPFAPDPFRRFRIIGDEDCLYLNVYTTKIPEIGNRRLKPVIFWIYGGGFTFGTSREEYYGPHFFMTQDVVVVTVNYRVGLLGFASFKDPTLEVPGNAGLKDQVMALKWVQRNIRVFGGNPNKVTLCGQDAGAASAHLMTMSPMAKGLFHKVIAQSGCAVNPWVLSRLGCEEVALAMGLEGADERTVFEALNHKTSKEVLDVQLKMNQEVLPCKPRPIGVVVEENSSDPFLDRDPMDILLSGDFHKVPLIIGYNETEGMVDEMVRDPTKDDYFEFNEFLPWTFGYGDKAIALGSKIKKFYVGDAEFTVDALKIKFELITDSQILSGIHLTIINSYRKVPVFFYRMSLDGPLNFFKRGLKLKMPGVAHYDELGYLFKNFITPPIKRGSWEDIYITRFVRMWTNFARDVIPTPPQDKHFFNCVWKVVQDLKDISFLDIGCHLVPETNPDHRRMHFWEKIFYESPVGKKLTEKYKDPEIFEQESSEQKSGGEAGQENSENPEILEQGPSGRKSGGEAGQENSENLDEIRVVDEPES